jgi:RNA polymerase sigma-70 factor (ECF subfamily)
MSTIEAVMSRSNVRCDVDTAPPRRPHDPDAGLVERLRRQEEGAAEALLASYGNRVYRLAVRITGNSSDAEEVVQDALWAATRKIDTFLGTAAFGSWIYRITANKAYEKLRGRPRKSNEVSWEDLGPSFGETLGHSEVVADWARRLRDPASEAELKSVLGDVIDQLPEDYRTAFLLHDVEGLSNPRIAETLHISLGTSKSRVHRARLFLRRRLADYVDERVDVAPEQALRSPRLWWPSGGSPRTGSASGNRGEIPRAGTPGGRRPVITAK